MQLLFQYFIVASVPWLIHNYFLVIGIFALLLVLCCRYTGWGKQFWLLNKSIIISRTSTVWWCYALTITLLLLISARLFVVDSYFYSNIFTAVTDKNFMMFRNNLIMSAIFSLTELLVTVALFVLGQRLVLWWRKRLTWKIQSQWIAHNNFYLFNFLTPPIDNPDQRIDIDTADFADKSLSLSTSIISAIVLFKESIKILWDLSAPLHIGIICIPQALFVITLGYIVIASTVSLIVGRPLVQLNFIQKIFEANYRFSLARIRINSKEIALRQSGRLSQHQLENLFQKIYTNTSRIITRRALLLLCTRATEVFPAAIVFAVQCPLVFRGLRPAGSVLQANQMVYRLVSSVSTILNSYDSFTEYRATLTRLTQFIDASLAAQDIPILHPAPISAGFSCQNLSVFTPSGKANISELNLHLRPGSSLLITGSSGIGKSTTLLALASLWPYANGKIWLPSPQHCMFISQQWFLPEGSLRSLFDSDFATIDTANAAGSVSHDERETHSNDYDDHGHTNFITDAQIRRILDLLDLSQLDDLTEVKEWDKCLSPGQIQRIAIGRAILAQPTVLFLDESTSALNEDLEEKMYRLLTDELPECTIISIGHRSTLFQFHTQFLQMLPDGKWELSDTPPLAQ